MPITVQANPANLTWANFRVVPNKILDPADGTLQDSFTKFDYQMPDRPARRIDGKLAFADPLTITITPDAQVWSGVAQTAALLSHEQFHYDIGIVTARAFARELSRLRKDTEGELVLALRAAENLHFITRTGLLQKRYDLDTRHGTQAHYQKIWKDRMTVCLADPNATQIGGFWL
ncbi:MAG: hypothetical protein KDB79_16650 [Acidobacteria bacterium]|nr:hypothetical protein [Acidobacteriota bacterium]